MTQVTVLRDRYAKSWPVHENGTRAYVLELGAALDRDYRTDAHFACYVTPNARRLSSEALGPFHGIEVTAAVFDVDCPETHGKPEPAPESWRRETREKVIALAADYPNPFFYETRGGARIVYRQEEPTVLRTQDDAREWSKAYAVAVAHLERYDLKADPSCADWTRLFRLPYATRTEGGRPERWCIWGEVNRIGTLLLEATHEDVDHARQRSKAFRKRRIEGFTSMPSGGDGLFFHALHVRGDIGKEARRGGWICRCPNRSEHTSDTDGTDSTVVFPAKNGHEIGAINCLHAHCQNLSIADWLRLFTYAELDAARTAAGIVRAA